MCASHPPAVVTSMSKTMMMFQLFYKIYVRKHFFNRNLHHCVNKVQLQSRQLYDCNIIFNKKTMKVKFGLY